METPETPVSFMTQRSTKPSGIRSRHDLGSH
jgi:hypothetical protein